MFNHSLLKSEVLHPHMLSVLHSLLLTFRILAEWTEVLVGGVPKPVSARCSVRRHDLRKWERETHGRKGDWNRHWKFSCIIKFSFWLFPAPPLISLLNNSQINKNRPKILPLLQPYFFARLFKSITHTCWFTVSNSSPSTGLQPTSSRLLSTIILVTPPLSIKVTRNTPHRQIQRLILSPPCTWLLSSL